jgi:hypothetical protein
MATWLVVLGTSLGSITPAPAAGPPPALAWRRLGAGIEYLEAPAPADTSLGAGPLHVVRVDPLRAAVRAVFAGEAGQGQTASDWCDREGLVVVTNAGMFEPQGEHNGYARVDGVVRTAAWRAAYRSVFVLGPGTAGLPRATVLDAVSTGASRFAGWATVIQAGTKTTTSTSTTTSTRLANGGRTGRSRFA